MAEATLQFKLRLGTETAVRQALVDALEQDGVAVAPLFPFSSDPELAFLYSAKLDEEQVERTLARLADDPAVEFAERSAPRKLIL